MIKFKKVRPEDKELFDSFYQYKTIKNCETAFANLCAWTFALNGEYAIIDNTLVTRVHYVLNKEICYHCPIGQGNRVQIIEMLIKDSVECGYKMNMMIDCNDEFKANFCDKFSIIEKREYFDYVYLRESLSTLSGKKLQAKRNHVNKFTKTYNYEYLDINAYNINLCIDFAERWLLENAKDHPENIEGYNDELKVIKYFADNFDALALIAGAVFVEGTMVAFTLGSKVNNETFCTHIEKANTSFDGAYAIINKEFSSRLPENYIYVNREEDLGLEGLRKAKLSYQPVELIHKTLATLL
ncbi:MAG: phosphatidylglycerol lysyltransferase domain-containing protein [Bacteroidales bacterium]|nr:phosphatidylglycerol lysyltransferase domain-containing protein [Bacteroidales bacterium]